MILGTQTSLLPLTHPPTHPPQGGGVSLSNSPAPAPPPSPDLIMDLVWLGHQQHVLDATLDPDNAPARIEAVGCLTVRCGSHTDSHRLAFPPPFLKLCAVERVHSSGSWLVAALHRGSLPKGPPAPSLPSPESPPLQAPRWRRPARSRPAERWLRWITSVVSPAPLPLVGLMAARRPGLPAAVVVRCGAGGASGFPHQSTRHPKSPPPPPTPPQPPPPPDLTTVEETGAALQTSIRRAGLPECPALFPPTRAAPAKCRSRRPAGSRIRRSRRSADCLALRDLRKRTATPQQTAGHPLSRGFTMSFKALGGHQYPSAKAKRNRNLRPQDCVCALDQGLMNWGQGVRCPAAPYK